MKTGSHRRLNLLTGDWVLVSPHRLDRPWQGAIDDVPQPLEKAHDPGCYLCPGNARAGGVDNPAYDDIFIFDNDFPALQAAAAAQESDALLVAEAETGICRVMCYAPEHHLTLSRLGASRVRRVVDAWAAQYEDLARRADISAVTIFENRGDMMGASSPHPHGQIWATRSRPNELAQEDKRQRDYFETHGRALLSDYLARECEARDRIVLENDHIVALVPFWATWPFETLVLPRRAVSALPDLIDAERDALASILSDLTARYDALFRVPFPYTMGWHQRPTRPADAPHFVAHAHFYPPLLRSATVRKFMVGFEMLGMPQRDLTPETAAERLRVVRTGE